MDQPFSSYLIWARGQNLTISRSNISKLQIFLKNRFHSHCRSYLVLNSDRKQKKSFEPFLRKNMKVSDFGLIWRHFRKYLQNKFFVFKNPTLSLFYHYSLLTSCKKSEKSFEPFLRKLRYQPTNQPTKYRVSDFGLIWRRFREYLQIKNFFEKSDYVTFLTL